MKEQLCKTCGKMQGVDSFAKGKSPLGLHYWCRDCVSKYGEKWRKENKDYDKERNRAWHVANAEKVRNRKMAQYAAKKREQVGE
jgi:hypothetical protein